MSQDRYAVIGHPVAHSRSPFIHARFAQQTGQSLEYGRIDATEEAFEPEVRAFFDAGGKGLNVTVPHKQAAARLVDELRARAAEAGAVNTIGVRPDGKLFGDNTDGAGLVRDLVHNHGVTVAGRRVLLLGAGGAARGVVMPLLQLEPSRLVIANRTAERALSLVQHFRGEGELRALGFDELKGPAYDLVINATSASLAGEVPPLPPAIVEASTFCYDMAYGRGGTPFVRWAQSRGCSRAVMGLGMLVEQAAESFLLWRGVRPDTASVLAALKAELAA